MLGWRGEVLKEGEERGTMREKRGMLKEEEAKKGRKYEEKRGR